MLYYAALLIVVAGIAAVFGFSDVAVGASSIARVFACVLLLAAMLVLLIGGFSRKGFSRKRT